MKGNELIMILFKKKGFQEKKKYIYNTTLTEECEIGQENLHYLCYPSQSVVNKKPNII